MSYNISDIEGIGETYAAKLEQLGIKTTENLLQMAGSKAGREKLAAETKIPESLILTWVNHSDLFRIKGIAGQTAEILEAAGVDTVKELATRKASNLHQKMTEVNSKFGLSGKLPTVEMLESMIAAAKKLDQKVFH